MTAAFIQNKFSAKMATSYTVDTICACAENYTTAITMLTIAEDKKNEQQRCFETHSVVYA